MDTLDLTIPDDVLSACNDGNFSASCVQTFKSRMSDAIGSALNIKFAETTKQYTETKAKIEKEEHNKREASAQGDLSENAEYHAAVEKLVSLGRELTTIERKLEAYKRFSGKSSLKIILIDDGKHQRAWTLVPDVIADIDIGALSNKSPVGAEIQKAGNDIVIQHKYKIWRLV